MEDFVFTRASEVKESVARTAFLEEANERTVAVEKSQEAASKDDVAARLDKELTDFSKGKHDDASPQMVEFQKLVGEFAAAADKEAAVLKFGPASQKLRVSLEEDAAGRQSEMEKEAEKVPGRSALDEDYSNKTNKLFDKARNLPSKEYERVLTLLQWKPGETAEDRTARVHDGLQNHPRLSKLFDDVNDARKAVENSMTAREKELSQLHQRDIDEAQTIRDVIRKVAIRVDISR